MAVGPGRTSGAVTSRSAPLGGRTCRRRGGRGWSKPGAAPRRGPQVPAQAPPYIPLRRGNSRRSPVAQNSPSPSRAQGGDLSSNRWKRRMATRPPPSDTGLAHSPPILLFRQLHPQAQSTAPYSPRASSDALPCRARPLHNSRASASVPTPGLAKARGRGGLWEL